jgi:Transposase DDE domain group 1
MEASEGWYLLSLMKLPPTASSSTDCRHQPLLFQELGSRKVVADFSGGTLSSDGGVLFLRQVDLSLGLTRRLAGCFGDQRHPGFVEHAVPELLAQRLYAEALGYEDVNDHQQLRHDPLLAAACGKTDPLGQDRLFHPGAALAAPATLNRLELSNNKKTRCHKLPHDPQQIQALLVEMGARCVPKHAVEIVLDLDAMGHRLHGGQEGRHFNAYYDDYVYLPLYAFVGAIPVWAQLRTGDHGAAHGVVPALAQIVAALRRRCKQARIIVRGDSGFCHDEIMAWCESQPGVYYCLGLAKNSVLLERCQGAMMDARARHCLTGATRTRVFTEFEYATKTETWSRARRVIAKAEVTAAGDNPRFVVTNLPAQGFPEDEDKTRFSAVRLYEELYCARGEMENVLKQQVLDLQADRMSTHYLASNQLRLWLATLAYLLMERVRALGLWGTELAQATMGSVRLKLLKVAAQVTVSVRRVYVQLSSAYPLQETFRLCHRRLMRLPLWSD